MNVLDVLLQLVLRCETQLADAATIGLPVLPLAMDEQVLLQGGLLVKCKPAHLTLKLWFASLARKTLAAPSP